jgi:NAD(P)-dependent dehydrogenase (short-subunit alcohol dehydrogenase family)
MSFTPEQLEALFRAAYETDVTDPYHRSPYPAVATSNPKLSQAGRTVLVTGGGTNIGFGISKAFVQAKAATVIIVARRLEVLEEAATKLRKEAQAVGTDTKIIIRQLDLGDLSAVEKLWKDFAAENITVDVFVNNAVRFSDPKPLLALGFEELQAQFDVNVRAAIFITEKFVNQSGEKQRFLINVTSQVIHMTPSHVYTQLRPAYALTKIAAASYFQLLALHVPAEKVQITSFHPGLIWNEGWEGIGYNKDSMDSDDLPGGFALWLASKESSFLHGRYAFASWDVDQLANGPIRKRIDEDPYFLRVSVDGLHESKLA